MCPSFQGERTLTVWLVELSGKVKTRSTGWMVELLFPSVRIQTSARPPRNTPRVTPRLMVRGLIGGPGGPRPELNSPTARKYPATGVLSPRNGPSFGLTAPRFRRTPEPAGRLTPVWDRPFREAMLVIPPNPVPKDSHVPRKRTRDQARRPR